MIGKGTRVQFEGYCIATGEDNHPYRMLRGYILELHGPTPPGHDCTVLINSLHAARCMQTLDGTNVPDRLRAWLAAGLIHDSGKLKVEANLEAELRITDKD